MKVIKRDGRIQELELSKVKTSILNSSIDSNKLINESDLKILVNAVNKKLESIRGNADNTSSYEILAVIVDTLKKEGFKEIAIAYLGFHK